ncbi:MAG: CapA family protein [Clostridia bacterium]|nr:CapA family protein [Clostridia bacterium]
MKRMLSALLAVMMLMTALPAAFAEEEDDLSMFEILEDADERVLSETISGVPGMEEMELYDEEEAQEPEVVVEADGSVIITVTATGDFTIGGDSRKRTNIFEDEMKRHGNDVNFTMTNIRDLLADDDLTIVNFEGTLTNSTYVPKEKKENQFLFSAPPEYVSVLADNSVEAVSLENNHVLDHGEEVYEETQQHLDEAGIVWSNSENIGVMDIKGVTVAMLSYLCIDRYDKLWAKVPTDIAAAKTRYDIVIVNFHWGNELDYAPTNNQVKMGRLAVDAGADLVIGHHSHRIQPIEQYKGVYICYSLGNFCFAGNSKPSDMSSIIFQTKFRVKNGEVTNKGFRIVPIRISSKTDRNDFIPTPLVKETAIDSVLTTLKANGKKLEYAVESYPLEW